MVDGECKWQWPCDVCVWDDGPVCDVRILLWFCSECGERRYCSGDDDGRKAGVRHFVDGWTADGPDADWRRDNADTYFSYSYANSDRGANAYTDASFIPIDAFCFAGAVDLDQYFVGDIDGDGWRVGCH